MERIGLFGGSFDPIHLGHLICAEQLSEAIGLDRVIFIPCSRQPHKPEYVPAGAGHRLEMVRLATSGRPDLQVSDIEIVRGGLSYTVDTVVEMRRQLGSQAELWLLMGMDAYLDLKRWKRPELLAEECRFAVACRPGYQAREQPEFASGRTTFVTITEVGLSSTDIRERITDGRSIRFLVPEAVEAYIGTEKPYPAP
jgi:nicotinate-nucleotide adenylyltransferase